jgi:glycosyltransferase involved in cell wall biosynthesis
MRRLKVAIVTQFPDDADVPRGGVEAVSVNLVRSLAALGEVEVHVVTLDPKADAVVTSEWAGARIHRLPRGGGGELANAIGGGRRQVQARLRALAPDIVHAHDTYGLMVQGLELPRVFTIHGFIYGDTLVSGRKFPWLRSKIWEFVEKRGWADQPHIISISPYVRERLAGVSAAIIHDIDNPIAADFFDIRRPAVGVVFARQRSAAQTLVLVKRQRDCSSAASRWSCASPAVSPIRPTANRCARPLPITGSMPRCGCSG